MTQSDSVQICSFQVGPLMCGIELQHIQEISGYQPMTPVPLASEVVIGLINLRGQVITVIDLRRRLSLPPRSDLELSCNLVVRCKSGVVSLLIDDIGDVLQVARSALQPPPQTLSMRARRYVESVLEVERELLLTLDIDTTTSLDL